MQRAPLVQGLFRRIQDEASARGPRHTPADDPPRIGVDDEGDAGEPWPGRDIGEVGDPQHVRVRRLELPVDVVQRARCRRVADRGPDRLAVDKTLQAHAAHQARDGAARQVMALAFLLLANLACTVDAKVLREDAGDPGHHRGVALSPGRQLRRIGPPGAVVMIDRRGGRQGLAKRLDPIRRAVNADERDHGLNRRSRSACFTRALGIWPVQPILAATDRIAAQRDECCAARSSTIRTARSRISDENLFVVLLVSAPASRELEPRQTRGGSHRLREGCRRRTLPPEYGPHTTVFNRWNRWSQRGLWRRIFAALVACADPSRVTMIDSSAVKAHRSAGRTAR